MGRAGLARSADRAVPARWLVGRAWLCLGQAVPGGPFGHLYTLFLALFYALMNKVFLLLAEFDVGLITVDMSINVTYPNLKPHLHELAELIAKELDIDSRQVRVTHSLCCCGFSSFVWR
jgi:hypothetical protein